MNFLNQWFKPTGVILTFFPHLVFLRFLSYLHAMNWKTIAIAAGGLLILRSIMRKSRAATNLEFNPVSVKFSGGLASPKFEISMNVINAEPSSVVLNAFFGQADINGNFVADVQLAAPVTIQSGINTIKIFAYPTIRSISAVFSVISSGAAMFSFNGFARTAAGVEIPVNFSYKVI